MFFGFFFFLLIRPPPPTYIIQTHLCCQSDDRYAESTRKIVVPGYIQRGRNFVVLKLAEDIKLRGNNSVTPRQMIKIACDLTIAKCTKDARS